MKRGSFLIHKSLDEGLPNEESLELNGLLDKDDGLKREWDELYRLRNRFNRIPRFKSPPILKTRVISAIEEEGRRWDYIELLSKKLFLPKLAPVYIGLMVVIIIGLFLFDTGKKETIVQVSEENLIPVKFMYISESAQDVALAGDFNDWDSRDISLSYQGDGLWSITISLRPGQYQYMFIIDRDKWVTDFRASDFIDDGFGNINALINVTASL